MPGTPDSVPEEREQLLGFVAQQRHVLRIAAYGLTDDQARATPTRSGLSVGGLVKHVAYIEGGWIQRIAPDGTPPPAGDYDAYADSHVLSPGETLGEALAKLDEVGATTDEVVRGIDDLDRAVALPDQPWFTQKSVSIRWVLLHLVEEMARHAGHADILREQIDGATAIPLMAAAEGWPASPWVQPWKAPGPG